MMNQNFVTKKVAQREAKALANMMKKFATDGLVEIIDNTKYDAFIVTCELFNFIHGGDNHCEFVFNYHCEDDENRYEVLTGSRWEDEQFDKELKAAIAEAK